MKFLFVLAVVVMFSNSAFGAEPADSAAGAKRAAALKADVKNFQLSLSYRGQSDKPYYHLLLSVQKVNVLQADSFFLTAQISEDDALQLISLLETSVLLAQAVDAKTTKLQEQQPSYRLTTTAGEVQLITNLGWSRDTLKHLDEIRKLLTGDAAKRMDTLLGRLSGHRREWNAAAK